MNILKSLTVYAAVLVISTIIIQISLQIEWSIAS